MLRFRPIFPVVLLLFFARTAPACADTLHGRVVNRTLEAPVAGCAVALIQHGPATAVVERDTTDEDGRFEFPAPSVADSVQTVLSAAYAGVDYLQPVPAGGGPVELPVYERTASDTAIVLASYHMVVDAVGNEVTQILIIRNEGNRTLLAGEGHGHGLEIPLPEGVTEILGGPQGAHTHGNILVDSRPVEPGGSQLMFAHALPANRRLVQEIPYPAGAVDVLILPADTPVLESSLHDMGEVPIGERTYRRLSVQGLNRGARVRLQLRPTGPAGGLAQYQGALVWGLGGLAVVFALLAVFYRPRKSVPVESSETDPEGRRRDLLEEIADLDDRFEAGELSESDYRTRRDRLKTDLVRITRAQNSPEA